MCAVLECSASRWSSDRNNRVHIWSISHLFISKQMITLLPEHICLPGCPDWSPCNTCTVSCGPSSQISDTPSHSRRPGCSLHRDCSHPSHRPGMADTFHPELDGRRETTESSSDCRSLTVKLHFGNCLHFHYPAPTHMMQICLTLLN